jgi:hypothetical protein
MNKLVLVLTAVIAGSALNAGCEDDPTDKDYLKDSGTADSGTGGMSGSMSNGTGGVGSGTGGMGSGTGGVGSGTGGMGNGTGGSAENDAGDTDAG